MIIVQVAGRVGRDPETRFTTSGQKVTSFSIASSTKKGNKEETVWWRVTIWGERFDKMMPYIKKGSALIVVGEMTRPPEMYTDKEGKQQVGTLELTAEIVRFSPFGNPDKPAQEQTTSTQAQPQQAYGSESAFSEFTGGMAGYGAVNGLGQEPNGDERMPF